MRRQMHNRGFVLVMVLAVLVIAGTILAAAACRYGQKVLLASGAQRDLQVRWGMLSCRALVLPAAEQVLQAEATDNEPAISISRRIVLGDMRFDLIVSDEQAKANVNLLRAKTGDRGLAAALRTLQSDRRRALHVELAPGKPAENVAGQFPTVYTSFDQLFSVADPSELADPELSDQAGVSRITCWGSGKVNFKRAEVAVLRAILAGVLDETQLTDLIRYRKEMPDCTLAEALADLELSEEQMPKALQLLTDASACHSLWIVARGTARSWHRFYVDQRGDIQTDAGSWLLAW